MFSKKNSWTFDLNFLRTSGRGLSKEKEPQEGLLWHSEILVIFEGLWNFFKGLS